VKRASSSPATPSAKQTLFQHENTNGTNKWGTGWGHWFVTNQHRTVMTTQM
jgi:hypothetical protein